MTGVDLQGEIEAKILSIHLVASTGARKHQDWSCH